MRVIWAELASIALQDTADYLLVEFGSRQQDEFLTEIEHLVMLMAANPQMGKTEPLLSGLSCPFRSIVVNPYNKLIYTVGDDLIEIVDFWDTRRAPASLMARLT